MSSRFTSQQLYHLRNHIPISTLIKALLIPFKIEDGIFRFLCPICSVSHTATNLNTNLARCFDCQKNFNTIDLVMMVRKTGFVDSVKRLIQYHTTGKLP